VELRAVDAAAKAAANAARAIAEAAARAKAAADAACRKVPSLVACTRSHLSCTLALSHLLAALPPVGDIVKATAVVGISGILLG